MYLKKLSIRNGIVTYGNYNFGLINEVKLSAKPVEIGKDSFGRTVIGGIEVKVEFNVMDTSNQNLNALYTLMYNSSPQTLTISDYYGIVSIPDVLIQVETELDYNGKPSKVKVSCDRIIRTEQMPSIFGIPSGRDVEQSLQGE